MRMKDSEFNRRERKEHKERRNLMKRRRAGFRYVFFAFLAVN